MRYALLWPLLLLARPLAPCALPARGSPGTVHRDWRKFVLFGVMAARRKIPAADQRRGPLHVQRHVTSLEFDIEAVSHSHVKSLGGSLAKTLARQSTK